MKKKEDIIKIDGVEMYTVRCFAAITGRSIQTIYSYIYEGNSIRKLKTKSFGGKPFVLASEYIMYPFTKVGPNSKNRVVHFNIETGIAEPCAKCSAAGGDAHE